MVRFMYAPTRLCVKSGNPECNQVHAGMYTYSNVIPKIAFVQIGMPVVRPHVHCKYIRSNYDGIAVYHRTSTIFRCNVPLHLNIPIAKVRYPKIYSDMIVKCQ